MLDSPFTVIFLLVLKFGLKNKALRLGSILDKEIDQSNKIFFMLNIVLKGIFNGIFLNFRIVSPYAFFILYHFHVFLFKV